MRTICTHTHTHPFAYVYPPVLYYYSSDVPNKGVSSAGERHRVSGTRYRPRCRPFTIMMVIIFCFCYFTVPVSFFVLFVSQRVAVSGAISFLISVFFFFCSLKAKKSTRPAENGRRFLSTLDVHRTHYVDVFRLFRLKLFKLSQKHSKIRNILYSYKFECL